MTKAKTAPYIAFMKKTFPEKKNAEHALTLGLSAADFAKLITGELLVTPTLAVKIAALSKVSARTIMDMQHTHQISQLAHEETTDATGTVNINHADTGTRKRGASPLYEGARPSERSCCL